MRRLMVVALLSIAIGVGSPAAAPARQSESGESQAERDVFQGAVEATLEKAPSGAKQSRTVFRIGPKVDVVGGELKPGDEQFSGEYDWRLFDLYALEASAGQRVTFYVNAFRPEELDPLLMVGLRDGSYIRSDDDGGPGNGACLRLTLPREGRFLIMVTSTFANLDSQYGLYHLGIDRDWGPCDYVPHLADDIAEGRVEGGMRYAPDATGWSEALAGSRRHSDELGPSIIDPALEARTDPAVGGDVGGESVRAWVIYCNAEEDRQCGKVEYRFTRDRFVEWRFQLYGQDDVVVGRNWFVAGSGEEILVAPFPGERDHIRCFEVRVFDEPGGTTLLSDTYQDC